MPNRREIILGLAAATASIWLSLALRACPIEPSPSDEPASGLSTVAVEREASESDEPWKACILVWLDGGPSTIDMWNLPSDPITGGPFGSIPTAGGMEISEYLAKTADVMDELSIVRSMSTREASHKRAYYYAHTGFVPNPNVQHPSAGAVIAQQLAASRTDLKLPKFVSINGSSLGAGYLDQKYAPFVVDSRGRFLDRLDLNVDARTFDRLAALETIDNEFAAERGGFIDQHQQTKQHALQIIRSGRVEVFRIDGEDPTLRERYGDNDFGRAMLMARRLVETGVPFVEVNLPGWDVPAEDYFTHLRENLLPQLDSGLSTLVHDLRSRGLLRHTVIVVMGAYGRSPRIGPDKTRAPWARSWSLLIGGGGLRGGLLVGKTSADGARVTSEPISFEDVWMTVAKSLGIDEDAQHVTRNGRPIKIFNGGQPIRELLDD